MTLVLLMPACLHLQRRGMGNAFLRHYLSLANGQFSSLCSTGGTIAFAFLNTVPPFPLLHRETIQRVRFQFRYGACRALHSPHASVAQPRSELGWTHSGDSEVGKEQGTPHFLGESHPDRQVHDGVGDDFKGSPQRRETLPILTSTRGCVPNSTHAKSLENGSSFIALLGLTKET